MKKLIGLGVALALGVLAWPPWWPGGAFRDRVKSHEEWVAFTNPKIPSIPSIL